MARQWQLFCITAAVSLAIFAIGGLAMANDCGSCTGSCGHDNACEGWCDTCCSIEDCCKSPGLLASQLAKLRDRFKCQSCKCGGGLGLDGLGNGLASLKANLTGGLAGGRGKVEVNDCHCGPATWCGYQAPSYPVPYPAPAHVGRTQLSYVPLMPHHSLPHYRKIYSFQHGPGLSRTNVHWHPSYPRVAWHRLKHVFELPR